MLCMACLLLYPPWASILLNLGQLQPALHLHVCEARSLPVSSHYRRVWSQGKGRRAC